MANTKEEEEREEESEDTSEQHQSRRRISLLLACEEGRQREERTVQGEKIKPSNTEWSSQDLMEEVKGSYVGVCEANLKRVDYEEDPHLDCAYEKSFRKSLHLL
jgi:hypothetical protein